jgi:hypothetical protein
MPRGSRTSSRRTASRAVLIQHDLRKEGLGKMFGPWALPLVQPCEPPLAPTPTLPQWGRACPRLNRRRSSASPRGKHPWAGLPLEPVQCLFHRRAGTFSGWDARRGAQPIVHLWASVATPQTARKGTCPKGWAAIGRFGGQAACMGNKPMRRALSPNSSRLRPNAAAKKTLNRLLGLTQTRMRERSCHRAKRLVQSFFA